MFRQVSTIFLFKTWLRQSPTFKLQPRYYHTTMSSWNIPVYMAGTNESPALDLREKSEVWLIKDPRLYFPLHPEKNAKNGPKEEKEGDNVNVYLWGAVIDPSKLPIQLQVEDHPQFKGVCLVKSEDPQHIKELESLLWKKAEVPQCRGGMTLIDFNPLLEAIVEYMKDNYPATPEEFNFQAELKVVSHWHWREDKELPRRKPGPREDFRIKKAVKETIQKWRRDLRDLKDIKSERSDESLEEYISGLEEDIFALRTYFKKGELEEDETEGNEDSLEQQADEGVDMDWIENNASIGATKYAQAGLGRRLNGHLPSKVETLQERRSRKRARR